MGAFRLMQQMRSNVNICLWTIDSTALPIFPLPSAFWIIFLGEVEREGLNERKHKAGTDHSGAHAGSCFSGPFLGLDEPAKRQVVLERYCGSAPAAGRSPVSASRYLAP